MLLASTFGPSVNFQHSSILSVATTSQINVLSPSPTVGSWGGGCSVSWDWRTLGPWPRRCPPPPPSHPPSPSLSPSLSLSLSLSLPLFLSLSPSLSLSLYLSLSLSFSLCVGARLGGCISNAAAERRGDNSKGVKDLNLEAQARNRS